MLRHRKSLLYWPGTRTKKAEISYKVEIYKNVQGNRFFNKLYKFLDGWMDVSI